MSLGPRISANAEVAHLHFDSPHDHARTVGNPEVEWFVIPSAQSANALEPTTPTVR